MVTGDNNDKMTGKADVLAGESGSDAVVGDGGTSISTVGYTTLAGGDDTISGREQMSCWATALSKASGRRAQP